MAGKPVTLKVYEDRKKRRIWVEKDGDDVFRVWIWSAGKGVKRSREYFAGRVVFSLAQRDLDRFAREHGLKLLDEEPACRMCGCTQNRACVDETSGEPCSWVEADLCSACVPKRPRKTAPGGGKKNHATQVNRDRLRRANPATRRTR